MANNNNIGLKVNVVLDPNQGYAEFNNWSNKVQAQVNKNPIKVKINVDGQQYEKSIETWIGKNHDLVEVTKLVNVATGKEVEYITKVENGAERVAKAIAQQNSVTKALANSQNNLNSRLKQSTTLFNDFATTFMKMAKFNTINIIYDNLTNSLSQAVTIVKEFNDATTELRKVSDLEGESLKKYAQDLAEYGAEVGRTMTDMVNSATVFKRTGATDEEAMELAKVAEMYRNVADSEISSADASKFLVSQMKAFNIEAKDSIHIIDAVNATANNFAVSTDDLQTALSKASASMATAGNTYEESIALVESATAIMQNQAGTVGNGFRTIAINIANLAAKSDEFVAANGKVSIALKDEQGQLRSTYEVLNDLHKQWNDLIPDEQMAIAVALAGKTRFNVLTSSMRNFTDAQKVLQTTLGSTNSAMEENARYMESIRAKTNILKAEFEKFILGEGGLEAFIKCVLDGATASMQFINELGGIKTILLSISTILAISLVPSLMQMVKNIANAVMYIPALVQHFQYAKQAGVGFASALSELTVGLNLTQIAIQGVVAAVGIAITAYNIWKQKQEEAQQAAYNLENETLEQVSKIQQQILALQNENASRKDLIKTIQSIDSAYKDEGQTIDDINKKRKESIDILKEEQEAKLQDAKNAGFGQYKKDQSTLSSGYSSYVLAPDFGQRQKYIKEGAKAGISFQGGGSEEYLAYLKKIQEHYTNLSKSNEKLNKDIKDLENEINEAKNGVNEYNAILDALNLKYDEESGKIVRLNTLEILAKQNRQESTDVTENAIDVLDKLGVSLDTVSEKLSDDDFDSFLNMVNEGDVEGAIALLQSYGIEVNNANENLTEFESTVSDFISFAEDAQSAYETLNKAAEEYNKQGYLSASTLKQLAKLQPEYLAQLDLTGEKATVLNGALQNQFEIEKKLALIHIQTAEQLDIVAYCEEYLGQKTNETTNALANDVTNSQALTTAYGQLTDAAYKAADAIATVKATGGDDDTFWSGLNERRQRWKDYYNEVEAMELNYASSAKSSAGSHKDAWVEAFKEEQRQLKHSLEMNEITEIEYYNKLKDLNEKYFGEISGKHKQYLKEYQENEEEIYKGLKSVYDKVADYLQKSIEKGYENAINALKKEEKQVLAEIKAQIDELKREKQDVLDDINEQINGLKKKKDKVLNYWNAQIDKIKESNNHLQQQNELLEKQQALQQAKAQKVMVMKGGKFELSENESAVSQAEQALSQYQDQQSYEQQIAEMEKLRDAQVKNIEDRISALEEYKDYMDRYYDEEIDALEQYYDEVQRQYEAQIEALQEQLDAFKKAAEEQKEIEEARLAAQLLGIEKESDLFEMSLSNLSGYVEKYNSLVSQLQVPSAIMNGSIGHTIVGSVANTSTSGGGGGVAYMTTRASGDSSFKNDEIALVGESPNAELVLGSHLNRSVNSGKLIHLSKGSGVVNAESTSTLAGLLNGIVSPTNVSNSRSTTQTFTFGNITLPNVTDGDSFVNTLSHKFNNYAIQYSSNRK